MPIYLDISAQVLYSVRTGTIAVFIAPSPTRSRRLFGILNATKKAWAPGLVPKKLAITISRTKPRIRLIPVAVPITEVDFIRLILLIKVLTLNLLHDIIYKNRRTSKLPIKKSAYKELRKARARHYKNISTKSELRTLAKNLEKFLGAKKSDEAKSALNLLVSKIAKAASKGVIKKNTAGRKISRIMKKFHSLSKA